jgi:hypothetical protein
MLKMMIRTAPILNTDPLFERNGQFNKYCMIVMSLRNENKTRTSCRKNRKEEKKGGKE